ncbi:MAG: CooT family nickel-binding protein [Candidatus Thiodiazotropha sp.]
MCMMTVKYAEESGGETIMENVSSLVLNGDDIELIDLFGERVVLQNARLKRADFDQGTSWILMEKPL